MSFSLATSRAWRTVIVAVGAIALLATVMVLGSTPELASAQDATTCYAIADSNEPGNLNSEGQVDTLIRIEDALGAPVVQVIGGNGGLGTGDAEAMAIRPLPDGTFQMHGWESGLNLFTIDPDTAATSAGPFSIPGKVEGLTWSGTDDNDAANDLLWATFGSPANQVSAYSATGQLVAGPITVEVGDRNSLVDLAWDQVTDQVFAIITNDTDVTDLITINPGDGSAAIVGATALDMEGLGFGRQGQLVGTTGNDGSNAFHLVDKNNGAEFIQSDLSAITGAFDFESVDCVRDSGEPDVPPPPLPDLNTVCYAISDSITAVVADQNSPDTLVRIDTSNFTTTIIGQIDGGNTISVEAFAIRPGVGLYGFDPDTGGGRLFLIDENDASVTPLAGNLGALGDVDGMTFSGIDDDDQSNDLLWMSIRNVGAPNDQLVAVDPASGAIVVGPLDIDATGVPGVTVNDIDAIAWDPVTGQVFGTAGSGEANSLVTINPANGAVTPIGAFGINDIEGLGFSNVGADNGFLFGTTGKEDGDSASALYLINTADPTASQQLVDLNGVTGVTDFESVDCLSLEGPAVPDGSISATLIAECIDGAGKLAVTISHLDGGPVDYTVSIAGQPDTTGSISSGDPDAMVMTNPDLADGDYAVTVTNETTQTIVLNETAPVDCVAPAVLASSVDSTCEDGAGKVTVTVEYVSGDAPGVFTVSVTGQPDQSVTLTEPGTEMIMYSGLADGMYDIIVVGNDEVLDAIQSNVVCGEAGIDIELSVNGEDADNPTGPVVNSGDPVTFEYKVTNNGDVPLTNVQVTDSVLGAIACPQSELAPDEMMTCTISGAAQPGQYSATGSVTGTPPVGPDAIAEDDTNYLGAIISIDLEKFVNGEDADDAPGPVIVVGEAVEFTYEVTNTGNVALTGLVVNDNVAGVITCPATTLEPGASVLCVSAETAVAGDQPSSATATADGPDGAMASDTDAANYFGEGSGLTLMTTVNGDDGLTIAVGAPIVLEYKVTNIGNTNVSDIAVIDDDLGPITCPQAVLLPGEMMVCTVDGVAGSGQVDVNATVGGLSATGTTLSASDPSSYIGASSVIGDFVWVDLNQNCIQDAGEPGVSGIVVNLWVDTNGDGAPDEQIDSTTTDETGQYVFNITETADYVVQFGADPGSYTCKDQGNPALDSNVNPDSGITDAFTVAGGASTMDVDAGLLPASLGDLVFVDQNANGVQDAGEPGVSGIVVNLWIDTNGDGAPDDNIAATTTDGNGNYEFAGLDPQQTYVVQFVSDGRAWTMQGAGGDDDSNADMSGITGPIDLEFGENDPTIDAGLLSITPGEIGGVVFSDANGNDESDNGEGVSGVTVKLVDPNGVTIATTTTNGLGEYSFPNVAPGDYVVMIDDGSLPVGLIATFDRETAAGGGADGMSPEALDEGELAVNIDFGYQACASIGDFVFADANVNGIQDPGEDGISGVTVTLWTAGPDGLPETELEATVSNSAGAYEFDCLDPTDSYIIQAAAMAGMTLTVADAGNDDAVDSDVNPISGITSVISLDPGQVNSTIDIGITGGNAAIDIQTLTNNVDADEPGSGPVVGEGSVVMWTYVVTNTGDVPLANVEVVDDRLEGVVCTFDVLAVDEIDTCTVTGTAVAGPEYVNVGSVTGIPVGGGAAVVAEDPTRHTVTAADVASIMITSITNGVDGIGIPVGEVATIEYVVLNTGNVTLTDVVVTDSQGLAVSCPMTELAPSESMVCVAQVVVTNGPFENSGSVEAVAANGDGVVSSSDPTSHFGLLPAGPGATIVAPPVASTGHIVTIGGISPNFTPPNPSASFTASAAGADAGSPEAAPLAMTGSNSMDLALIAAGAILAGTAFVALSRRRERFES